MKIRNIEVGSYIQSKKDSKQLIAGHCYQVVEKDVSDKTVRLFSVDDSFDDSLWFCVSDFRKPKPLLKQLDQSVFNNMHERWRFAAVDKCAEAYVYVSEPKAGAAYFVGGNGPDYFLFGQGYDASNWQNSLIERDTAKELLEVDLSSELTGSELCKAMLARGDKYVMCLVSDSSQEDTLLDGYSAAISSMTYNECFYGYDFTWLYATPINNRGEPLTAAEAGL